MHIYKRWISSNETTIVDAFFEGLRILILGKENMASNLQNRSLERLKYSQKIYFNFSCE